MMCVARATLRGRAVRRRTVPRRLTWLIALSLFVGACQAPLVPPASPIVTFSPASTPIARTFTPSARTRVSVTEGNFRIEIAMFDGSGRTAIAADIGSTVTLTIAFRPSKDTTTQWSDGSLTMFSEGWSIDRPIEMRYCTGMGSHCVLPDQWIPFAKEEYVRVAVDWVGLRDYGVTAQFREASGASIPAGYAMTDSASQSVPISGIFNERTPVAAQPLAIQTTIAQARAALPVVGKVQVGQGSATGGKAGTTIEIPVNFEANSPAAPVGEMRIKTIPIGRCLTTEEMADAPWEPFASTKTFFYRVALNWTTFKLHVQYRDRQGNLSPVYCGEIAVEGQP